MLGVVAMLLMPLVVSTSCRKQKPDAEPDESQNSIKSGQLVVYSNDRTKWTYVSFVQGKVVGEASSINPNNPENTDTVSGDKEWKARKDWDVALSWTRWRTNGGTSGDGGTKVAMTDIKDFDALRTIPPAEAFFEDSLYRLNVSNAMGESVLRPSSANMALSKVIWMKMYDEDGNLIMPPLTFIEQNVFVLRIPSGQYVKLQVLDYFNEKKERGYIKFRWAEIKAD